MTVWWVLVRLELQTAWRYGVLAVIGAVGLVTAAVLAALPTAVARPVAPWVLLLDTALLGTTVIGALVILEREQGVRASLAVSPVRLGKLLAVRVGVLAAVVVAAAAPIAVAGRPRGVTALLLALLGVGLVAVLTMLLAVALAAARESLLTFMVALPAILLPLVAPALAHAAGLSHPLLYAVPTVGAVDLIQAGYGEPVAGLARPDAAPLVALPLAAWLAAACALAAWLAHRQLRPRPAVHHGCAEQSESPRQGGPAGPADLVPVTVPSGRAATSVAGVVLAFLRTDLAAFRRDPLLVILAVSPLLLGLALRFGYPPVREWLLATYGFELDPYRPLLLSAAVVLHVPVTFGMVGALMVLDDSDSRALTALRVSPLTLPRYLAYRTGAVAVAAGVGLAVATPVSGLAPASGQLLAALAAAVPMAPLVMLVTLAVARDKTTGAAMLKLLGLPIYAPLALWWLAAPGSWLLAPLPSWWVLQAQWNSGWYAVGGIALMVTLVASLTPRACKISAPARA